MPEQVRETILLSPLLCVKAEIGSGLRHMSSSSHPSLPDWGLNSVPNYSWWHPLSTARSKQQADVTMASNTWLDKALKPQDFV